MNVVESAIMPELYKARAKADMLYARWDALSIQECNAREAGLSESEAQALSSAEAKAWTEMLEAQAYCDGLSKALSLLGF